MEKLAVFAFALSLPFAAQADWKDYMKQILQSEAGQQMTEQVLSNSEIVAGLKEALAKGTTTAINQLGQTGGYLGNELVRIALPSQLQTVAKGLRGVGQGYLVDEFETTINRAAEEAVPFVADIFGNSIRQMSIADAQQILQGGDQAATDFFRRTASDQLAAKISPLVQQATAKAGVTSAYKRMVGQAGFFAQMLNLDADSLDQHVTQGALDGLFTVIGQQEASIRNNPAQRTTEILRDVFGQQ